MSLDLDKDYLKNQQYKSTNYLDSRIAIHKFNINKQSFFEWSWDQMSINADLKILEVGCGPGTFWLDNKKKLSNSSSVLMTDFSEAMINKARNNLTNDSRFTYEIADIDNLKYNNEEFDLVMAHFVLYHALNKDIALSELRRVCNRSGRVSITTNSEQHMLNVYEIGKIIDDNFPTDRNIDTFTEEIADQMLPKYFSDIEKHVSLDYIRVDQIQLILDYVRSAIEPRKIKVADDFYQKYAELVGHDIENKGYFEIPKRSPIYLCKP